MADPQIERFRARVLESSHIVVQTFSSDHSNGGRHQVLAVLGLRLPSFPERLDELFSHPPRQLQAPEMRPQAPQSHRQARSHVLATQHLPQMTAPYAQSSIELNDARAGPFPQVSNQFPS